MTNTAVCSLTRFSFRAPVLRVRGALGALCLALAACGGGGDSPAPDTGTAAPIAATAPVITQQPANISITAGQPASFTVVATGTAPLAYQWQRNGVAIGGATGATYSLSTTALADSGVVFNAVVSNALNSVTSTNATLTVTAAAPVLTITPQPANVSTSAGTQASFTVGGTCSAGTLYVQWQRNSGAGGAFVAIAGATAATYTFTTAAGDSGSQFRAMLDCSGQSAAASNAATLTVTAPGAVTLSAATVTGLRAQAAIGALTTVIDRQADGSWVFYGGLHLWRLAADMGSISVIAGSNISTVQDGSGLAASFGNVSGITHDASGNLWVVDQGYVRRVTVGGMVTTIAGGGPVGANGIGTAAGFSGALGIAMGPDGDLYVADQINVPPATTANIRRVTTAGVVTTYTTGLLSPHGVVAASNNDLFISEDGNALGAGCRVSRIVRNGNAAGATVQVAGNGSCDYTGTNLADGPGASAIIPFPNEMLLRATTLFVRDGASLLRAIDLTAGTVSTVTGSTTLGSGYADGTAAQARLAGIGVAVGLADGPANGFVVTDGAALRVIDAAGSVRTIANGNTQNSTSSLDATVASTGVLAQLPFDFLRHGLTSLAVDAQGRIVIGEANTTTVRRIDTAGNVTLLAGLFQTNAAVDGTGSAAQVRGAGSALAIAPSGLIYVPDAASVRRLDPATNVMTTLAGSNATFFGNGAIDGPASAARFGSINGLAVASNGDVIVSDGNNTAIRRVDASTGNVTTFSGVMGQRGTADGNAATARYDSPLDLARASDGTLVLNDNGKLRRIALDGSVTTTATTGVITFVLDPAGNLYVLKVGGLYAVSGTGVETLLVPVGSALVLGNTAPTLGTSDGSMAMLGPKQIAIVAARALTVVTLP